MQRDELRHVERRKFPRVGSKRLDGIDLLGRVELSWCDHESHDAVLSLREGPRRTRRAPTGARAGSSARCETGQALSRLLNVADGLLGQGGRCLLLITTNEPVGRLHPAVRRPGRCWAQVEFGELSPTESAAWLARHGSDAPVRGPTPLAKLYAIAEGRELVAPAGEPFGFGVR